MVAELALLTYSDLRRLTPLNVGNSGYTLGVVESFISQFRLPERQATGGEVHFMVHKNLQNLVDKNLVPLHIRVTAWAKVPNTRNDNRPSD